jgi:hypothetical protein
MQFAHFLLLLSLGIYFIAVAVAIYEETPKSKKRAFPYKSHPAVFLLVALIPGRYARDFYLTWGPWVATLYLLSCPVQVRMHLLKERPHKNCSYSVTEMDAQSSFIISSFIQPYYSFFLF